MCYRVSVVVPTCRRPALLQRCLSALLTQTMPAEAYEVIVVDDADCPQTRQQLENWLEQAKYECYTLRYISVPASDHHGPAAARNKGWRAAQGEIIAFTDDDCIPLSDWLTAGVEAFSAQEVMAVSGQVIVPLPDDPTDYERNAAGLATSEFVTANCFYLRDALLRVGGFDEQFTAAWREDSDLYFTLLEHNMICIVHPEAKTLHPVRPMPWGVSIKQQGKSMFNALLYKKHPALYRERIQAAPPWHYYGIVLALLIACIGLLSWINLFILGGLSFWILLTGRFCWQRLRNTSHVPMHIFEMMITSVLIPPLAVFWRLAGMVRFRVLFL